MTEVPDNSTEQNPPSAREGMNRLFGLSSYALGVILVGFLIFLLIENGIQGIKKDVGSFAIFVVATLICFGIGYTTSRPK